MHIQSSIAKTICTFLCALMIFSCIGNTTLTAQASDLPFAGNAGTYLDKLVDMALSKSGIVANDDIIGSVKADFVSFMQKQGDGFIDYCVNNSITEVTADAWIAYVNTLSLTDYEKNFCIANAEFIALVYKPYEDGIEEIVISNEEALQTLGISDATYGKQYTIPSVAVNFMRNLFKNRETEYAPYVMIPTYSPDTIPSYLFATKDEYSSFKKVLASIGDNEFFIHAISAFNNGAEIKLAYTKPQYYNDFVGLIQSSYYGDSHSFDYVVRVIDSIYSTATYYAQNTNTYCLYDDTTDYLNSGYSREWDAVAIMPYSDITSGYQNLYEVGFCTNDGRNIPLFKDLESLKAYSAGQAPYYTTTTYNNWDSSTDNSITYTGDYLIDNSSERSYTTINTSEDYSQTNIDNSVTNITNNYIYTSPNPPSEDEGSGEDEGSDSGLTLGDALNTWVTAIKEFITFALNLLGEAVALISGFLNDALSLLTGLTDSFSGFTGLLASMFSFLPQEVIDALSAGIVLIIVLGVIKGLKG